MNTSARTFITLRDSILMRDATGGKVRRILDWWHISMRIQHVENAVKGLLQIGGFSGIPVLLKRPAKTLR